MQIYTLVFRVSDGVDVRTMPIRNDEMALSYARASLVELAQRQKADHAYVSIGIGDAAGEVDWLGAWDWFAAEDDNCLWTPTKLA